VSLFDAMMKSRRLISMPIGFFFGGISVAWIALIYFVCPEVSLRLATWNLADTMYGVQTKGRTSSEIDELFENNVPAWKSATYFNDKEARAALQATGEAE
jgi:hypothetical protein